MRLLSFPFRLGPDGSAVTVEDGSDAAHGEQIAALIVTRPGERPLVPAFGVDDPAFHGITAADIAAGVEVFGPDVEIDELEVVQFTDDGTLEVGVTFSPLEGPL